MVDITFIQTVVLSLLVGALLGLEREYTKKQSIVGLRTFSLISLFGALLVRLGELLNVSYLFTVIGFIFVSLFSLSLYVNVVLKHKIKGFTTNFALIISYVLGVFVGYGLYFEAVFLSIVVAIILFSRERLHKMVEHLTQREVGDLLEFLVLLGIIYPLIPENISVYGLNIPLLMIWALAVAISMVNFAAFIGARYLKAKHEIGLVSFLGGLMSSTITVASLINFLKQNRKLKSVIIPGFSIATAASMVRNFGILMIAIPELAKYLLAPLILGAGSLILFSYFSIQKSKKIPALHISSPFNVPQAIKLGLIFLGLFIILDLSRGLGSGAFLLVAFFGGMVSGTGVAISLISLFFTGVIGITTGGVAIIIANVGGAIADYAYCYLNKAPEFFRGAWQVALSFIITGVSFWALRTLLV